MSMIAEMMDTVLQNPGDKGLHRVMREKVKDLCTRFPFYSAIYSL
jgi:glycine/serine hydroxymethyltransferase